MPSLPPDCSGARRAWSVKRATRAGGRRMAAEEFRGSASAALLVMFSEAAAHLIYAAADIVLVPSLFEPCGPPCMRAHAGYALRRPLSRAGPHLWRPRGVPACGPPACAGMLMRLAYACRAAHA